MKIHAIEELDDGDNNSKSCDNAYPQESKTIPTTKKATQAQNGWMQNKEDRWGLENGITLFGGIDSFQPCNIVEKCLSLPNLPNTFH